MADSLRDLVQRLDRAAVQNGRGAPKTARTMGEAADSLRGKRMEDRVRATQRAVGTAPPENIEALERTIGEGLNDLEQRLQRAAESAKGEAGGGAGPQQALERLQSLVRGMQSMDGRGPGAGGNVPGGGGMSREEARQLSREMRERLGDARALREQLAQQGVDVAPLDRVIQGMGAEERTDPADVSPNALALRAQVLEGLKAYEFALRRQMGDAGGAKVLLDRSGEVPAAYRSQVEEYYRSVSKPPKP